ncbi:MAG: hypothetical protein WED83_06765 [Acidimicrobiia bacterium]
MTPGSHHHRFGSVMWGTIGITFFLLALVALLRLDPRIAGYAVGTLVLVCLVVCIAAFWMDSRASRETARLIDRLRSQSKSP